MRLMQFLSDKLPLPKTSLVDPDLMDLNSNSIFPTNPLTIQCIELLYPSYLSKSDNSYLILKWCRIIDHDPSTLMIWWSDKKRRNRMSNHPQSREVNSLNQDNKLDHLLQEILDPRLCNNHSVTKTKLTKADLKALNSNKCPLQWVAITKPQWGSHPHQLWTSWIKDLHFSPHLLTSSRSNLNP